MALNIKDEETSGLARELAELTGASITAAVRDALVAELGRVRRRDVQRHDDLAGIIARGRSRAVLDERTEREILGYGDDGLPE